MFNDFFVCAENLKFLIKKKKNLEPTLFYHTDFGSLELYPGYPEYC